jgi:branched-chain amino acid transport system substrate-binding protein
MGTRMKHYKTGTMIIVLCLAAAALICACSKPKPIKIGFVGGLTGRAADLGVDARNGTILAVEQRNSSGGIKGRPIELVIKDDGQVPETARKVLTELMDQGIECIIGPTTSSMAMTMVPLVNASKSILLAPTVTSANLSGKDDNFIRVTSDTTSYAGKSAKFQFEKLKHRKVAAIYDLNNSAFTESWFNEFSKTFEALGGKVILTKTFNSSDETVFTASVRRMVEAKPDVFLVLGNAVDSAMICQQIRRLDPKKPIVLSEWSATERFIELCGVAAEGIYVAQYVDRNDRSERFQAFLKAYWNRFGQDPGYAGVAGYDAATVAIEALAARESGQTLKDTIIRKKQFQCVQQILSIDQFGDADRKTFVSVIRNGRYLTQE